MLETLFDVMYWFGFVAAICAFLGDTVRKTGCLRASDVFAGFCFAFGSWFAFALMALGEFGIINKFDKILWEA